MDRTKGLLAPAAFKLVALLMVGVVVWGASDTALAQSHYDHQQGSSRDEPINVCIPTTKIILFVHALNLYLKYAISTFFAQISENFVATLVVNNKQKVGAEIYFARAFLVFFFESLYHYITLC